MPTPPVDLGLRVISIDPGSENMITYNLTVDPDGKVYMEHCGKRIEVTNGDRAVKLLQDMTYNSDFSIRPDSMTVVAGDGRAGWTPPNKDNLLFKYSLNEIVGKDDA